MLFQGGFLDFLVMKTNPVCALPARVFGALPDGIACATNMMTGSKRAIQYGYAAVSKGRALALRCASARELWRAGGCCAGQPVVQPAVLPAVLGHLRP
eukprot:7896179-Heterocapsa_arctica.AAC.1